MEHLALFTLGNIVITVLVSYLAFSRISIYGKYCFDVEAVLKGRKWYRLFTSIFLHADWSHLIFNMFSFFSFAAIMETRFGTLTLAAIYFGSGLAGNLLALLLNLTRFNYRAVGASGSIAGVIFASIFLIPGGSIIIFPLPFPVPAWTFAFIFILATLYGVGLKSTDIGHEAHLGGALAGIASAVIIEPSILTEQTLFLSAVIVPVLIFLAITLKVGPAGWPWRR
jgi:membrane associated rhomboid family serine protease